MSRVKASDGRAVLSVVTCALAAAATSASGAAPAASVAHAASPSAPAQSGTPAPPPDSCDFASMLARVVKVEPSTAEVTILKRGAKTPVRALPNQCLQAGERIAVKDGVVTLETPAGRRRIGRYQDSNEFATPDLAMPDVPRGPKAAIETAIARLTASTRPGQSGAGRGEACDPESLTPPVVAVPGLPAGEQRVGSDVATLQFAWDATGGARGVRVVVKDADRNVVAERTVCEASSYEFDLEPKLRKPGTELLVEAGPALSWHVRIVEPATLPQPSEPLPAMWLLGAWRLEAAAPDTRMDALSRLRTGAADYLGASMLLRAAMAPK